MAKTKEIFLLYLLIIIQKNLVKAEDVFHPKAQVWSITPHIISDMGGVITIYGRDFAADSFTFNDPDIGNKVY